jgi:hypothetical protein
VRSKSIVSVLFVAVLVAGLWSAPAAAAVRVYVNVPPPPLIVETPPPPPSPTHIWIRGYHRWDGRTYVWVPGRYVVAPRPHSIWVPGHWAKHRRGWYWVEGHWRRR